MIFDRFRSEKRSMPEGEHVISDETKSLMRDAMDRGAREGMIIGRATLFVWAAADAIHPFSPDGQRDTQAWAHTVDELLPPAIEAMRDNNG